MFKCRFCQAAWQKRRRHRRSRNSAKRNTPVLMTAQNLWKQLPEEDRRGVRVSRKVASSYQVPNKWVSRRSTKNDKRQRAACFILRMSELLKRKGESKYAQHLPVTWLPWSALAQRLRQLTESLRTVYLCADSSAIRPCPRHTGGRRRSKDGPISSDIGGIPTDCVWPDMHPSLCICGT